MNKHENQDYVFYTFQIVCEGTPQIAYRIAKPPETHEEAIEMLQRIDPRIPSNVIYRVFETEQITKYGKCLLTNAKG